MASLPFLLRLSFEGMVFALVFPSFWVAVLMVSGAGLWVSRRDQSIFDRGGAWELFLPWAFPIAILIWAAALYGSLRGQGGTGWRWQANGIDVLLLLQVVLSVFVLTRHRARLRLGVLLAILAMWWAAGASFVAGMAVYDDWL